MIRTLKFPCTFSYSVSARTIHRSQSHCVSVTVAQSTWPSPHRHPNHHSPPVHRIQSPASAAVPPAGRWRQQQQWQQHAHSAAAEPVPVTVAQYHLHQWPGDDADGTGDPATSDPRARVQYDPRRLQQYRTECETERRRNLVQQHDFRWSVVGHVLTQCVQLSRLVHAQRKSESDQQ